MPFVKKILSILLRISISVVILFVLFRQVDAKAMLKIFAAADKPLLLISLTMIFINYILCLFRWDMLLRAAELGIPFKRVVTSFCGGIFFNLFLPSTIGGDFMRSIDLAAHTRKPKEIVATVFLDRLSGYIGMVMLTLLAVGFGWQLIRDRSVLTCVIILTGILTVALLVLFNNFFYTKVNKLLGHRAGRVREIIRDIHQEIYIFRNHKEMIWKNLAMSFLVQLTTPVQFYLIALALGVKINIMYFFVFVPVISAITLLPISIGGLGLRDATTIYFFAKAGVLKDISFAMSLISFLFIIIIGAAGGIVYVFTVHNRRLQPTQPSAIPPHQ
ncbi:MAG: flippase-like domain-containing protein [Candidatus Omnitrophica bacterium]|nr:flippase-like domain-containing protein [Candidatus Omnitrophota bacterium]